MMNTILKVISLIFCSTAILKAQPTVNKLLCIHTVANETEMNAITNPYPGSLIFVNSENTLYYRNTTQWKKIGNDWQILGNNIGDAFIGSTNQQDLKFKTNNQERMTIESNGNIGINTSSPQNLFEVNSKIENVDVIPPMISNTSNMCSLSGSVSALATQTTFKDAFDNDNSTNWFCSGTDNVNVDINPDIWVVVDFWEPIHIQEYSLRSGSHSQRVPKEYRLQAYTDGVNWINLETPYNLVTPNDWASVPLRTHTLSNNTSYRYYRLYFSASYENYILGTSAYANYQIDEIELKADVPEFIVTQDNRVGINTLKPEETLHVNGNIFASAFLTPDYVFEHYFEANKSSKPDCQFKSLDQVYNFVKKNHHLPSIPSKEEVEKQGGIVLNRAVELQLEKIEELYLHLIEVEDYVSHLEKKYQQLK